MLIARSHSDDNHVNATAPKAAGRTVQAKGIYFITLLVGEKLCRVNK